MCGHRFPLLPSCGPITSRRSSTKPRVPHTHRLRRLPLHHRNPPLRLPPACGSSPSPRHILLPARPVPSLAPTLPPRAMSSPRRLLLSLHTGGPPPHLPLSRRQLLSLPVPHRPPRSPSSATGSSSPSPRRLLSPPVHPLTPHRCASSLPPPLMPLAPPPHPPAPATASSTPVPPLPAGAASPSPLARRSPRSHLRATPLARLRIPEGAPPGRSPRRIRSTSTMAPANSTGSTGPPPQASPLSCVASTVACSSSPPWPPSSVPATPPPSRWQSHGRWHHGPRVLHSGHQQAGQIRLLLAGRDCHAASSARWPWCPPPLLASCRANPFINVSVEHYKRGNALGAPSSEFFRTKPYACQPSRLPKYAPNKEMDAKLREDALRSS
ncbi:hypothetical protein BS78_08G155400 [Paspalum vaginatum]|nr:hypothetical protein BS78_08G155400 [Paspalum vaginatum]